MAYKLEFSKQVVKFLDKSEHQLKIKIIMVFEQLSNNPRSSNLDIKAMINKKGHFRLRIGKYRFLYEMTDTELFIYVYKADSRGDVYKS
ncbi:MAG: type II toxin-antitoxin system RelE/ParE family toxin [Methylococcales bacterium]|nr:type II toxin-antitoxin system RelE/ParE family toxin [Methylococcales bacterium]